MINKNQLYKNMAYLLINIFKSDKLKANIIKSEEFKINVLLQINNLLSLEKYHDCNFDGNSYAIAFAQSLVNLTEKEQTIEKQEDKPVQEIEGDYSFLLTYILNVYGIEKEKMSISSDVSTDLIEQLSHITDQSLLKPDPIKPDSIIDNNENRQNKDQNAFSSDDFNNKNMNSNFNSHNNQCTQPNLMFLNSVPPHPATDPRFYPFLTKPKHMPLIKVFLLIFVIGVVIANIILLVYILTSSPKIIDLNSDGSSYEFWVDKKNSNVLINPPGNNDNYTHYGKDGTKLQLSLVSIYYLFPAFFLIIMAVYISYQIFKKPATIREKFRIRPYDLILLLFLNSLPIFFWSSKFASEKVLDFSAEKDEEKAKVKQLVNFINNYFKDSREYQISMVLAIVSIALATISLLFICIVLFINPKPDPKKINLANEEYQKAVANAMSGKSYEFNPTLFDEFDVEEKPLADKNQK